MRPILDRLEQHGYVRRMINPQDRRSFCVVPTERGQQAVETFLLHWRTVVQGVLGALTPTEQLVLIEVWKRKLDGIYPLPQEIAGDQWIDYRAPTLLKSPGFCVFAAGFAVAGCKARSKNRREPPKAASNQASDLFRFYLYTGLTTK